MEKMDIAIAAAGAVVLVLAITGSALYGGTNVAAATVSASFPVASEALAAQTFAQQGASESSLVFEVPQQNVTRITFSVTLADPAGQTPSVHLTAVGPDNATYEADGTTLEVALATPPAAGTFPTGLPAPTTNGTGEWTLFVAVQGVLPLPVPYSGEASATVESYAAKLALDASEASP